MSSDRLVCQNCGYAYDPKRGDPRGGVAPGTPDDCLPEDWHCPVCLAGRRDFVRCVAAAVSRKPRGGGA